MPIPNILLSLMQIFNKTILIMKRLFTIVMLMSMFSLATFAGRADYMANTSKVNAMFENASEMSMDAFAKNNLMANSMHKANLVGDDLQTTMIVAFVVDWIGLGGLGIHRYILGTKPSMFAIYFITCGGIFGIVPLIDGIMIIVDGILEDNGEKFIDNENFLMWK